MSYLVSQPRPNEGTLCLRCPAMLLTVLLLAVNLFLNNAHADKLIFKDGRRMEAVILDRSETTVTVQDGSAQMRIPMAKIVSIVEGTEADEGLIRAKGELAGKRISEGALLLGKAADLGADPESLADLMLAFADPLAEELPKFDTLTREAMQKAVAATKEVRTSRPSDFLSARVRWLLELGETNELGETLAELSERHPRVLEGRREEWLERFGEKIDQALDAGEYSKALDLLVELRRLDTGRAGEKRAEMVILWARRERDEGRYEQALRIYAEQLYDISPNIAQDRIALTLDEAERAYRAKNEIGRALDLYETFGLKHDPERSRERMVAIWREIGWQFLRKGEIAEARKVFGQAEALLPGSVERDLNACQYEETRAKLDPTDAAGQYTLAEWCLERGMLEEARRSFDLACASDLLRGEAIEQIKVIANLQAEEELKRLVSLYERGQYVDVLQGTLQFHDRPAGEGLMAQAKRLEELSRDAIKISATARPQQAEVLMQRAEREYWTGEIQGAYDKLMTLTERYADTPAGARAAQFYRTIRPRLDLDTLERRRNTSNRSQDETTTHTLSHPDESSTGLADEIRKLRDSMRAEKKAATQSPDALTSPALKTEIPPEIDLDTISAATSR